MGVVFVFFTILSNVCFVSLYQINPSNRTAISIRSIWGSCGASFLLHSESEMGKIACPPAMYKQPKDALFYYMIRRKRRPIKAQKKISMCCVEIPAIAWGQESRERMAGREGDLGGSSSSRIWGWSFCFYYSS